MSVALTRNFALALASRHTVVLFYAIAAIVALYPLLGVNIPPLVDYPAHLARLHILSEIERDAALQANYEVAWRLIPNLGMDVFAPLAALLGAYGTGKLFVALAILTPVAGVMALRRVLYGTVSYAPALTFFAAYNLCLAWGFLNFLFAAGLSLIAYAGWIASREAPVTVRIACFAAAAMVLYLAHLFAFAAYALLIGLDTIIQLLNNRGRSIRNMAVAIVVGGSQFLVPGALMLAAMMAGSGGYTQYGTVADKLRALMTPFFSVGTLADLLLAVLTVLVIGWAAVTRRLTVAPAMRAPILMLVVVGAVMPVWLMHTWLVDIRMPMIVAFVVIAAAQLHIKSNRGSMVLLAIVAVLFAVRLMNTADYWSQVDRDYAEFRAAVSVIPQGSRIFSIQPPVADQIERAGTYPHVYWGLPSIAVIERSAFVPTLFTDPEKQILQAAPSNKIIDTPYGRPPTIENLEEGASRKLRGAMPELHQNGKSIFWTDWPHRFDYVISLFVQPPSNGVGKLLSPVHAGSYFTIYRVVAGSCDSPPSAVDTLGRAPCIVDANSSTERGKP